MMRIAEPKVRIHSSPAVSQERTLRDVALGLSVLTEPEGFLRSSAELGLRYRSRDLAKIGQLVLGRGEWNGRRIVSAHWIDESIAAQIGVPDRLYFFARSVFG
jgi:CubicO group peptidase (beta-lactamase class C family)